MNDLHIVTGAGPVGWTVATQLADKGHRVRVLTRSGSGPEHPLIERISIDLLTSDPASLFEGASAVYHCVHGSSYSAKTWRSELFTMEKTVLDAAARHGIVVVFPESLYSYGKLAGPMTEDSPRTANTGKPGIRTELLELRQAASAPTVSVIASDFFGPHVLNAHAGDRIVPNILHGKVIRLFVSKDTLHSFTYVPDFAAAMIAAAADRSLWNTVLHAPTGPAVTQRQFVQAYADAAGVTAPKLGVLSPLLLRTLGVVMPSVKELAEMTYQFDAPFIMDSRRSEAVLGLEPTPLPDAAAATIAWWRTDSKSPLAPAR